MRFLPIQYATHPLLQSLSSLQNVSNRGCEKNEADCLVAKSHDILIFNCLNALCVHLFEKNFKKTFLIYKFSVCMQDSLEIRYKCYAFWLVLNLALILAVSCYESRMEFE
jgi:hypothetical protein